MPRRKRARREGNRKQRHTVDRLMQLKVTRQLSYQQMKDVISISCKGEEAVLIQELLDREFRHAPKAHRLHGCSICQDFIWLQKETFPCPNCQTSDGRYDSLGQPKQEVFYFSLLPRLESMYSDPEWRRSLEYPQTCRSDVFDGKEYRRLRTSVGACDHFVSFGFGADCIGANANMSRSLLPGMLSVNEHDPRVRYKHRDNLILVFLMPPKIKTDAARKFYQLLEEELNELFYQGIAGGALKGALLMTRADQKGKEFDLGLRSCNSYDGPCTVCEVMANAGIGSFNHT